MISFQNDLEIIASPLHSPLQDITTGDFPVFFIPGTPLVFCGMDLELISKLDIVNFEEDLNLDIWHEVSHFVDLIKLAPLQAMTLWNTFIAISRFAGYVNTYRIFSRTLRLDSQHKTLYDSKPEIPLSTYHLDSPPHIPPGGVFLGRSGKRHTFEEANKFSKSDWVNFDSMGFDVIFEGGAITEILAHERVSDSYKRRLLQDMYKAGKSHRVYRTGISLFQDFSEKYRGNTELENPFHTINSIVSVSGLLNEDKNIFNDWNIKLPDGIVDQVVTNIERGGWFEPRRRTFTNLNYALLIDNDHTVQQLVNLRKTADNAWHEIFRRVSNSLETTALSPLQHVYLGENAWIGTGRFLAERLTEVFPYMSPLASDKSTSYRDLTMTSIPILLRDGNAVQFSIVNSKNQAEDQPTYIYAWLTFRCEKEIMEWFYGKDELSCPLWQLSKAGLTDQKPPRLNWCHWKGDLSPADGTAGPQLCVSSDSTLTKERIKKRKCFFWNIVGKVFDGFDEICNVEQ